MKAFTFALPIILSIIIHLPICWAREDLGNSQKTFPPIASTQTPSATPVVDLPNHAQIPKVNASIQIDGKFDETFWKEAAILKPFYLNDASAISPLATEVHIAYDDTALYLGWICEDNDIRATYKEHDSKLWEEEVAEFFVTSNLIEPNKINRYFELQWNPLGTTFDAIIDNQLDKNGLSKTMNGDWSYTAQGMKSAVWVDGTVQNESDTDRVWQVEVAIPFSALNCPTPKAGDVWRADFFRYNRAAGKTEEYYSWSPTRLASFHQPSRFGYLEFQSAASSLFQGDENKQKQMGKE